TLGSMRVTVAGFGNLLRGDDGFGVRVAELLVASPVPSGVEVFEIGIGGIHLVQELLQREVDALVLIDAVDVGRPPGTLVVFEPPRVDMSSWGVNERRDALADMHYATPDRAMLLAEAMGVLPPVVRMVGCQHVDAREVGEGLHPEVAAAVVPAAEEVRRLVAELGIPWTTDTEPVPTTLEPEE
ncbi:MAG: hydrogenase maturation protease, partial [Actinobacteria bacterium]|nr:hydrogenase maturation protease [Actinomycetota bacterium]